VRPAFLHRPERRAIFLGTAALMPDVLPGEKFVLGSAVGNITYQASQILGFVAGAAVVAILGPHTTLGVDAATFGLSALIVLIGVRSRPAPERDGTARSSLWSVSADGIRIVFGNRLLLTLLLFRLASGLLHRPRGPGRPLRAFAARQHADRGAADGRRALRHGDRRLPARPGRRPVPWIRMMGWLAVLSCAPLIGSAWSPPRWAVLVL
jgi:hypothetical protein